MTEMTSSLPLDVAPHGFDFSDYRRNQSLIKENKSGIVPLAMKTGTTIVGIVYDGGVVLGADTRATSDSEVAEKNCTKIDYLAPNMYCCGAGTAADTTNTCQLISAQLEFQRLDTHRSSRVVTAVTLLKRKLFPYQGHISAALVLGGCDINGPHVYQIYPHGSTSKLPYTSMGSGSLAAMAVMESSWRENMNEVDAVKLVERAIGAGIFNDLGSGGNCDICIIRTDGTADNRRNAVKPNEIAPLRAAVNHSDRLNMRPGITAVLKTEYLAHPKVSLADVTVTEMEVESS
jgi:20S proteasome subunit beta 2